MCRDFRKWRNLRNEESAWAGGQLSEMRWGAQHGTGHMEPYSLILALALSESGSPCWVLSREKYSDLCFNTSGFCSENRLQEGKDRFRDIVITPKATSNIESKSPFLSVLPTLLNSEAFEILITFLFNKCFTWGFPGGAVVKNPPANAGDTGSSPGPERSHMLRSN